MAHSVRKELQLVHDFLHAAPVSLMIRPVKINFLHRQTVCANKQSRKFTVAMLSLAVLSSFIRYNKSPTKSAAIFGDSGRNMHVTRDMVLE